MKNDEAIGLYCPYIRQNCVGKGCIAWTWTMTADPVYNNLEDDKDKQFSVWYGGFGRQIKEWIHREEKDWDGQCILIKKGG